MLVLSMPKWLGFALLTTSLQHSRQPGGPGAECVVWALAQYNHGVPLADDTHPTPACAALADKLGRQKYFYL